jgi:hypothetical protein
MNPVPWWLREREIMRITTLCLSLVSLLLAQGPACAALCAERDTGAAVAHEAVPPCHRAPVQVPDHPPASDSHSGHECPSCGAVALTLDHPADAQRPIDHANVFLRSSRPSSPKNAGVRAVSIRFAPPPPSAGDVLLRKSSFLL